MNRSTDVAHEKHALTVEGLDIVVLYVDEDDAGPTWVIYPRELGPALASGRAASRSEARKAGARALRGIVAALTAQVLDIEAAALVATQN